MTKEKTVETSVILKKVFQGILSENEALEITKKDINYMFRNRDVVVKGCVEEGIITKNGLSGNVIGNCPICGGNVYEAPHGFICEYNGNDENDCKFIIFKEDKYLNKLTNKKLNASIVASLLKKGYIIVPVKSKKNVAYELIVKLVMKEDEHVGWEASYEVGKCPICGGNVKITPFGYICENNNDENKCFFILYRKDKFIDAYLHKELSLSVVMNLLKRNYFTASVETKDHSRKYKLKIFLNIDRINKKISWEKEYQK